MGEVVVVKVGYAKTHLSALLARVEAGEEIVIQRGDAVVAKLVPATKPKRELGFMRGPVPPDSVLFEPMSEDDLKWAEGGYDDPDLWLGSAAR